MNNSGEIMDRAVTEATELACSEPGITVEQNQPSHNHPLKLHSYDLTADEGADGESDHKLNQNSIPHELAYES